MFETSQPEAFCDVRPLECTEIRFRSGLCPGPSWRAHDAPSDPLVGWEGEPSPFSSPRDSPLPGHSPRGQRRFTPSPAGQHQLHTTGREHVQAQSFEDLRTVQP